MGSREFESLKQTLSRFQGRLALVGTGKNAGKTTVLNFLLEVFSPEKTAVSSVGRDGEEYDVVEKHPKPRIHLQPGTLFATARSSLTRCAGTWKVEQETDFQTPLGEVLIARTISGCRVELAGPSQTDQMIEICEWMQGLGATRVLIDGAFDRMASSAARLSQAVILAAGSSGKSSAREAAGQTCHFVKRFKLPVISPELPMDQAGPEMSACRKKSLTSPLLAELDGRRVILPDPSCCLIDEGDWRWIDSGRVQVFVERSVPVLAVFTNPFRPHLVPLPAEELLETTRRLCPDVSVFDLKIEGVLAA